MRIIDSRIRDLVLRIEAAKQPTTALDGLIRELIFRLHVACQKSGIRKKYAGYDKAVGATSSYPIDEDGFAVSFDVLTQEDEFYEAWRNYGFVVGKSAINETSSQCRSSRSRVDAAHQQWHLHSRRPRIMGEHADG